MFCFRLRNSSLQIKSWSLRAFVEIPSGEMVPPKKLTCLTPRWQFSIVTFNSVLRMHFETARMIGARYVALAARISFYWTFLASLVSLDNWLKSFAHETWKCRHRTAQTFSKSFVGKNSARETKCNLLHWPLVRYLQAVINERPIEHAEEGFCCRVLRCICRSGHFVKNVAIIIRSQTVDFPEIHKLWIFLHVCPSEPTQQLCLLSGGLELVGFDCENFWCLLVWLFFKLRFNCSIFFCAWRTGHDAQPECSRLLVVQIRSALFLSNQSSSSTFFFRDSVSSFGFTFFSINSCFSLRVRLRIGVWLPVLPSLISVGDQDVILFCFGLFVSMSSFRYVVRSGSPLRFIWRTAASSGLMNLDCSGVTTEILASSVFTVKDDSAVFVFLTATFLLIFVEIEYDTCRIALWVYFCTGFTVHVVFLSTGRFKEAIMVFVPIERILKLSPARISRVWERVLWSEVNGSDHS